MQAPIDKLLLEAKNDNYERNKHQIKVYGPSDSRLVHGEAWEFISDISQRPMETVVMDETVKSEVLLQIDDFLRSAPVYAKKGIPHRLGYLLWGETGTGKSSFAEAIAGKFEMPVYLLSLSKVSSDRHLTRLCTELPGRCVLLMEDIDCSKLPDRDARTASYEDVDAGFTSLAGLLNALDGIGAPQGRVLMMTTNDKSKLDPALVRPGRIDRQIAFRRANSTQAAQLFQSLFGTQDMSPLVDAFERLGSVPHCQIQCAWIRYKTDEKGALEFLQGEKQRDQCVLRELLTETKEVERD